MSLPALETRLSVPDGDIKDILTKRNANDMTDNNKNGLIEPWEFSNPTILSGDIKASEKERNVYHVIYSKCKCHRCFGYIRTMKSY